MLHTHNSRSRSPTARHAWLKWPSWCVGTAFVCILIYCTAQMLMAWYMSRYALQTTTTPQCMVLLKAIYPTLTETERILLRPDFDEDELGNVPQNSDSACGWLRARKIGGNAGVGHATAGLNYFMQAAMQHRLTLYTDYGVSGHGLREAEIDNYFGFGCLFHRGHSPYPRSSTVIPSSPAALEANIAKSRKATRHVNETCNGLSETVYDTRSFTYLGGNYVRKAPNDCTYNKTYSILRKAFRYFNNSASPRYLPPDVLHAKNKGDLVFGVHVRRGDVLETAKNVAMRFVSLNSTIAVIKSFLAAKAAYERDNSLIARNTQIYIVTEEAPNSDSVVDYDTTTNTIMAVNVSAALEEECNESGPSQCRVKVFLDSEASALQGFSALCESDVMLASASGFSHLAAILCAPKLLLAVPFWCSYSLPAPDKLNTVYIAHGAQVELQPAVLQRHIHDKIRPLFA